MLELRYQFPPLSAGWPRRFHLKALWQGGNISGLRAGRGLCSSSMLCDMEQDPQHVPSALLPRNITWCWQAWLWFNPPNLNSLRGKHSVSEPRVFAIPFPGLLWVLKWGAATPGDPGCRSYSQRIFQTPQRTRDFSKLPELIHGQHCASQESWLLPVNSLGTGCTPFLWLINHCWLLRSPHSQRNPGNFCKTLPRDVRNSANVKELRSVSHKILI